MQDDPTLNVNLTRALEESKRLADSIKPGSDRWDVIVVGSGAAGGMAAFQLAMAGVKVLLLEGGRMIDVKTEYRTMEWPYASNRRGRTACRRAAGGRRRVQLPRSPVRLESRIREIQEGDVVRGQPVHPQLGRGRAEASRQPGRRTRGCARTSSAARRTSGAVAPCATDRCSSTPQAATASTSTGRSPYDDVKPYYDKVDVLLGCSGTNEGLLQVPDGVFQRPSKLNCIEVAFKRAIAAMGRHYIPGRAGVTTEGVLNNKYRARCAGRGRCGRGCDIERRVSFAEALIYPARDSGNMTVRPYSRVTEVLVGESSNRAIGVRVIDANTREVMDFKAPVVVLGAGALDTTRILLNSRSSAHPNGLGNSSGVLGCYLSEHIMGIRGSGYIPARIGTETTLDDGRAVSPYVPRFRNVTDKHPDFIRGYHFQGGGGCAEYPGMANDIPGYGKAFKSNVRKHYPALISLGGFGEVLPRKENRVTLDPSVKDAWGVPVLQFDYVFRDNELKMAKDMADSVEEMLRAAKAEDIEIVREPLPPGWSIHEIGTARMGDDPRTSVTDRFCRLHDAKNVYIADAAPFVCGGTQNTTWSILAMAWRTMDFLKERLKAGDA